MTGDRHDIVPLRDYVELYITSHAEKHLVEDKAHTLALRAAEDRGTVNLLRAFGFAVVALAGVTTIAGLIVKLAGG